VTSGKLREEFQLAENPYITCRELIDFIMDYLNDALPAHQRDAFDRHLAVCPSCVAYLRTYEQTVGLSKSAHAAAPDEPVPASVPEELVQAILAARPRPKL
jgi:anti-sigma factor RsiW